MYGKPSVLYVSVPHDSSAFKLRIRKLNKWLGASETKVKQDATPVLTNSVWVDVVKPRALECAHLLFVLIAHKPCRLFGSIGVGSIGSIAGSDR